ncbi:SET domain-containing protein-lysine N-methyltransferase [Roseisolibacter sp. H3M3-2]|uniref:SET domain-containing protein n=1 Tax=Roseisolibacter sp. H3M3-2 TaxID=3031323 RepID=UPI0023DC877D|nr:SET domain-containing protein-lysine N-methyltransferase [Roseisolibacter sp. H3M3-2]MDF1501760.1 SET domain-containing protein-lysine N-methyltransferase [Roseisolibacter sp. H3M3-2]
MPARTRQTPDYPFEIRRSAIQGRGAFATRRIRPGQRIIEYTGERITPEEGDRRYEEDGMGRHHTFLFTVDEETCVDGKKGGNESRYINHSCDPNCEAVIEDGRIWIYAKRSIQPGAELAYDYQYERTPQHTKEDEEFYRCLCGTAKCRGTILAPAKKTRAPRKASPKKASAKKTNSGGAKKAAKASKAAKATKATKAAKRSRA